MVTIGPDISAGSRPIFCANIGREAPKHLAMMMVKNKVIATSPATCQFGIEPVLLTKLTDNSKYIQAKLQTAMTNPVTIATRNSFHITLP